MRWSLRTAVGLSCVALLAGLSTDTLMESPSGAASQGHLSARAKTVTLRSQRRVVLVGPGSAAVTAGGLVFLSAVRPTIPNGSKEAGSELYALSRTGKLVWHDSFATFPTAPPVPAYLTPPAVGGGKVYLGWIRQGADQFDGQLNAFQATNGKLVYGAGEGGSSGAPTVSGGIVYSNWQFVCCEAGVNVKGTEALDAATGGAVFTTTLDLGTPTSPPAVAAGRLYVASGGTLNVFDALGKSACVPPPYPSPPWHFPAYCAPLWSASVTGTITGTPRVADGTVFVGAQDILSAFPAGGCGMTTCTPVWTATANGPLATSSTSSATTLFIGSQKGKLYAFPVAGCGHGTCSPTWTASVGGALTAPTISGTTVYVGSSNGNVYGFSTAGCSKSSCAPILDAHVGASVANAPTVDDGHLFVTDTVHTVHIFKLP